MKNENAKTNEEEITSIINLFIYQVTYPLLTEIQNLTLNTKKCPIRLQREPTRA